MTDHDPTYLTAPTPRPLEYGRKGRTLRAGMWRAARYMTWCGTVICIILAAYAFKLTLWPEDVLPRGGLAFMFALGFTTLAGILLFTGTRCGREMHR